MAVGVLRALSSELLDSVKVEEQLPVVWNGRTYRSPDRLLKATANSSNAAQTSAAKTAFTALAHAHREVLISSSDHLLLWVNKAPRPLLGICHNTPAREAAKATNLGGRALMALRSELREDDPARTTRLAIASDSPRWMSGRTWVLTKAVPQVLAQLAAEHKLQSVLTGVLDESEQAVCRAARTLKVPVWGYIHPDREPSAEDPFLPEEAALQVPMPGMTGSCTEQDRRDVQSRVVLRECDSVLAILGPQRLAHTERAIRYATASGKPLILIDGRTRRVRASWPSRLPSLNRALTPVG